MEISSFDGSWDGDHNGVGLVEISFMFAAQGDFFPWNRCHLAEYSSDARSPSYQQLLIPVRMLNVRVGDGKEHQNQCIYPSSL